MALLLDINGQTMVHTSFRCDPIKSGRKTQPKRDTPSTTIHSKGGDSRLEVHIHGDPKEIAALVLELQEMREEKLETGTVTRNLQALLTQDQSTCEP